MSEPDATRPDQPANQPPPAYQPPPAGYQQPMYQQAPAIPQSPQPTPLAAGTDYTGAFSRAEVDEAKVVSIIGYLGILFLLPMLIYPKNGFARFHANQSLVVFISYIVLVIAASVLSAIVHVLFFLTPLVGLATLVFIVLGMINAGQGQAKALPLIGNIQILK